MCVVNTHAHTHTCFGVTESCQEKAVVYLVGNQDKIVIIYIYIERERERARERVSLDLRTH